MKLYYHKTDGGAEYYSLSHLPNSDEADLYGTIMRVDGGEIEIFMSALQEHGIELVIN